MKKNQDFQFNTVSICISLVKGLIKADGEID